MITTFTDRKPQIEPITANHKTYAKYDHKKQHVVVIEDNEGCRIAFELMLKPHYRLTIFQTAEEALDYLRKHWHEVDLVFLDNKLPGMSGLSLITIIRKDARLQKIPIVLQTASYRELLDEVGAMVDYYIQKPFKRQLVLKAISKVLNDKFQHFSAS